MDFRFQAVHICLAPYCQDNSIEPGRNRQHFNRCSITMLPGLWSALPFDPDIRTACAFDGVRDSEGGIVAFMDLDLFLFCL
ncbi:MAG TPA: hypothetical protein VKV95_09335 [Terriglobia bacterium]|nr:hypothetical protein [Terriglobia bacterium]